MKHALAIAADRALTRYLADALAESGQWAVARAHSGLEALVFAEEGRRGLDALLLAARLPDWEPARLVARIRATEAAVQAPLFVLSARGEDARYRRELVQADRVASILDVPVSPADLVDVLERVERRRRVLVFDLDADRGAAVQGALLDAGFVARLVLSTTEAPTQVRQFGPDLALISLEEQDPLRLCASIKRRYRAPKVLLYGPLSRVNEAHNYANGHRADDFLAHFDLETLVHRTAALVGVGADLSAPASHWDDITSDTSTQISAVPRAHGPQTPTGFPQAARRTHVRVPLDGIASLCRGGEQFQVRVIDVSEGGISLLGQGLEFSVGEPVQVECKLPEMSDLGPCTVGLIGRVAWISGEPKACLGVVFNPPEPGARARLDRYIRLVERILYTPES